MAHKCYISFKVEDEAYKLAIENTDGLDIIHKSLTEPINSTDDDYIMQVIRDQYLSDSTVTIHLIGLYGAENSGWNEQKYIKRELQASLYHSDGNTKNGVLGVVLPSANDKVYKGTTTCAACGGAHTVVAINDATTIKEFSYNYYIPSAGKCSWSDADRYCVLVPWDTFAKNPTKYIDEAFAKRTAPIAAKTRVRPT